MRFNVVVFDSKNKTYLSEFKHDKIIKLDKKRIDKLIGCDSSQIDNESLDFLLKIALIKKYKNLVYINSKFVSIEAGFRKEILWLYKVCHTLLFMMNTRNIIKNDIFFSKKCPQFLKKIDKNISISKNFFLKKEVYKNYIFKNISWENLPYDEW